MLAVFVKPSHTCDSTSIYLVPKPWTSWTSVSACTARIAHSSLASLLNSIFNIYYQFWKKKKKQDFFNIREVWFLAPDSWVPSFLAGSPSFINEETLYTESIIWICWIIVFPSRYIIGFVTKTFCKILHFLLSNLNFSKPTNLKWLEMRRITSMW